MELDHLEHRLVRGEGVNLHMVRSGRGTPVVLLHGFPQTWWEWRKLIPLINERHTVVAFDLRGAGHSDCPQSGYDKATLARDVHATLTSLGYERYAVCGHDIGGMVAVALDFLYPDAVTHLAVLDVPVPGWSRWESLLLDPRVWHFSFHMKRDLPERLVHGREYDYVSTFIHDRAFDHGAHHDADIDVFTKAFTQPGRTRGGLEWYRAFQRWNGSANRFEYRSWG